MNNATVAFAVLSALFGVYVIAATWRSRSVGPRARQDRGAPQATPWGHHVRSVSGWQNIALPRESASARSPARASAEPERERATMDAIFILIIIGLYLATHWLAAAVSRLGGVE